jgi:hypothetical protein
MSRSVFVLLFAGAFLTACSEVSGPPASAPSSPTPLSQGISFDHLQGTLGQLQAGAVARVYVALDDQSPIAAALSLKDSAEARAPERVRGGVSGLAMDAAGDGATLTLAPGLLVHVGSSTALAAAGGGSLTFQDFVTQIQGDLGQSPPVVQRVEARRTTVTPTVGPTDAFPAESLELESDGGGSDVSLNVTSANLVAVGGGGCDQAMSTTLTGCIQLLGFTAGVDSTTRLNQMRHGTIEHEFAGVVDCGTLDTTDARTGKFDLAGQGLHILVDSLTVAGEHHERSDADSSEGELDGLVGAATACAAGDTVYARGEGVPDSSDASTIHATEVRFGLARHEGRPTGGHQDHGVELMGTIDSIVAPDLFVGGREIVTDSATEIHRGDSLITLADLAAGDSVHVEGTLQTDSSVRAREITVWQGGADRFNEHDGAELEGVIDSIAAPRLVVSGHAVVTDSTTVIRAGEETVISFGDLRVGEPVEVAGTAQTDGSLLARLVEVERKD